MSRAVEISTVIAIGSAVAGSLLWLMGELEVRDSTHAADSKVQLEILAVRRDVQAELLKDEAWRRSHYDAQEQLTVEQKARKEYLEREIARREKMDSLYAQEEMLIRQKAEK